MSALYHGCCNGHDWTTDARNTTLIWTFVQLPSKLAAQASAHRYSTIRELRSILEEKVKAPCGYVGRRDIRIKEPSSITIAPSSLFQMESVNHFFLITRQ
jgi:hypothetical protein